MLDKRSLLSANYLFRDLDQQLIDQLTQLAVTRRLGSGEVLFFKGDEGDALYGILDGRVRISTTAPNGKEVVLSMMERGDVFGEIALLDGLDRTADAIGAETTELLMLQRRDFLPFLKAEPDLATHLLSIVCKRLRDTSARIEDIAFLDLPARLAKNLLHLAQHKAKDGTPVSSVSVSISQSELANYLGTSRESVNKHLQVWRRNQWIELGRSRVRVLDQDALEEVIESGFGQ